MTRHEEQINLLGVFHYVVGGLAVLCSGWPMMYGLLGLLVLFAEVPEGQNAADARLFGVIFTVFPLLAVLLAWALAAALISAGHKLRGRRNYLFCLITAGLACAFFPFGTALGVCAIVVLTRSGVRGLFAGEPAPPPVAPDGVPPPVSAAAENNDALHLDLLGIFQYVFAGLTAFFSCFALIYIAVGIAFMTGAMPSVPENERAFGAIFVVTGALGFGFCLTLAALQYFSGRGLRERRWHTFCTVMAALECLSFPLGTALGVFTLMVLSRPAVKAMFGVRPPRALAAR